MRGVFSMRPDLRRLALLVVSVAAVSLLSASAAAPGPPVSTTALLHSIESGIPDSQILKSRVGTPPRVFRKPGQLWLHFTTNADTSVDYVHGLWDAQVVTGLFAAAVQARGLTLGGTTLTVRDETGTDRLDDESAFEGLAPVRSSTARELSSIARRAVANARLKLDELTIGRPNSQFAIQITAVAANPSAWLGRGASRAAPVLNPLTRPPGKAALCEGVFLLVTDRTGEWVSAHAFAARTLASIQVTNGAFG